METKSGRTRMRVLQVFLVFVCLLSISFSQMKDHKVTLRQDKFLTEEQGKQELMKFAKSYSTKAQWEKRADNIRKQILVGAELYPMPKKTALKPIITSKRTHDGYTVENVAFESMPGFFVTGNLYRPTKEHKSYAVILCPHGHFFPDSVSGGGRFRKDMQIRCATFAKMGTLVFAYDMVGWGESTQFENFQFPQSHDSLRKEVKYQLWNSIRAVDFMLTLKGADPKRIACTGESGGGTQTFLLTAVDDRVAVSVPVVQVSAYFFGGCICESGMPIHKAKNFQTNNVEIAAIAAPRPMLLVSDGDDWTKNNPEVEYPHIKYIYGLLGKPDLVKNAHFPTEKHGYDYSKRAAVYPFLAKYLGLDLSKAVNPDGSLKEEGIVIEDQKALYAFDEKHPFSAKGIRNNDGVIWK